MNSNDTFTTETYRCYCKKCDWESEVTGEKASAAALFGHGINSGHSETFRELKADTEQ